MAFVNKKCLLLAASLVVVAPSCAATNQGELLACETLTDFNNEFDASDVQDDGWEFVTNTGTIFVNQGMFVQFSDAMTFLKVAGTPNVFGSYMSRQLIDDDDFTHVKVNFGSTCCGESALYVGPKPPGDVTEADYLATTVGTGGQTDNGLAKNIDAKTILTPFKKGDTVAVYQASDFDPSLVPITANDNNVAIVWSVELCRYVDEDKSDKKDEDKKDGDKKDEDKKSNVKARALREGASGV